MNGSVFSLKTCYAISWRSFSKWWIPLCLISAAVLLFEVGPRILLRPEASALKQALSEHLSVVKTGTTADLDAMLTDLLSDYQAYAVKLSKIALLAFPFVALLSMILLTWANAAVKDRRNKNSFGRLFYIAWIHVCLALIKGIAFVFFIFPGVYLYIRLLFVTLVLLEDREQGVWSAVKRSWALTEGDFWSLLALISINTFFQLSVTPTLIGLIPATGFVNTARAAAYQMLKRQLEETVSLSPPTPAG